MPGELRMTKEEIRIGLAQGRRLVQEEWAHPLEKQWVDELVAEGAAKATPFTYIPNFQCARRLVTGAPPEAPAEVAP